MYRLVWQSVPTSLSKFERFGCKLGQSAHNRTTGVLLFLRSATLAFGSIWLGSGLYLKSKSLELPMLPGLTIGPITIDRLNWRFGPVAPKLTLKTTSLKSLSP